MHGTEHAKLKPGFASFFLSEPKFILQVSHETVFRFLINNGFYVNYCYLETYHIVCFVWSWRWMRYDLSKRREILS